MTSCFGRQLHHLLLRTLAAASLLAAFSSAQQYGPTQTLFQNTRQARGFHGGALDGKGKFYFGSVLGGTLHSVNSVETARPPATTVARLR